MRSLAMPSVARLLPCIAPSLHALGATRAENAFASRINPLLASQCAGIPTNITLVLVVWLRRRIWSVITILAPVSNVWIKHAVWTVVVRFPAIRMCLACIPCFLSVFAVWIGNASVPAACLWANLPIKPMRPPHKDRCKCSNSSNSMSWSSPCRTPPHPLRRWSTCSPRHLPRAW